MEALTPEQMRALADKRKAEAAAGRSDLFDPIDGWAIEAEAALWAAADQLEAVQGSKNATKEQGNGLG